MPDVSCCAVHVSVSAPFIVHHKARLDIIALKGPQKGLFKVLEKAHRKTDSQEYKRAACLQW